MGKKKTFKKLAIDCCIQIKTNLTTYERKTETAAVTAAK